MDNVSVAKKYAIMVVEDEKLLLEAIDKKLQLAGFGALLYQDGKTALEYLESSGFLPDLIWLDYYLGDMTGDVFLKRMREILGEKRHIPVLVVSNSASPEKVEETLKSGADKYVLKADYKLENLVGIVRQMLG